MCHQLQLLARVGELVALSQMVMGATNWQLIAEDSNACPRMAFGVVDAISHLPVICPAPSPFPAFHSPCEPSSLYNVSINQSYASRYTVNEAAFVQTKNEA